MPDLRARLTAIFEGSPEAMAIAREGVIVDVNPSHLRLFGYAGKDRVIGRPFLDLFAPAEREVAALAALRANPPARPAEPGPGQLVLRAAGLRSDGAELDLEVRITRFREGEAEYALAFLRDLGDRAGVAEALRQSQRRMERILEGMPDGFAAFDREWRCTWLNRSAAVSARAPRDALLGQPLWNLFPALRGGEFHQACLRAREQRETTTRFDVPWEQGDGQLWYDYTVFPYDEGVAVHFRDVSGRRQAEEAARRFQFMVDRSPEEAYLVRRDGSFAYVNETAAASLGYPVEELLHASVARIDPEFGTRFPAHFDELKAGPRPPFETVHRTRDGRLRVKEMRSFHLRIGEAEYVCAFGQDITTRKQAEGLLTRRLQMERALRLIDRHVIEGSELHQTLRAICQALVELGHRMCWVGLACPDGRVEPVAAGGASEGYLDKVRTRWDDSPEGRGPTGTAMRSGRPHFCTDIASDPLFAPWREEAERQGYRSSVAFPLVSAEQEVIGTLNAYRDQAGPYSAEDLEVLETFAQQCTIAILTDRRGGALRDALRRLSLQVERMPLGHVLRDPERRVLQWNPAAERIFGWSAAEAVGRRDDELIVPAQERARDQVEWEALLAGRPAGALVRTNQRRSGEPVRCEWHDALLRDDAGKLLGVLSMVADVTEKTQLERQLAAAQRMEAVGVLAGGIAHDFNNLLTGIIGFGELLRQRFRDDAQAVEDLGQILLGADRAAALTRQLLAFARRQPMDPLPTDMNRVVRDLLKLLLRLVGEHVEVKTDLAPGLPLVRADPGKIEQLLVNLCINARDAMPGGGQLRIATSIAELGEEAARKLGVAAPGRFVRLTISDTGLGIEEALRDRIFEPFFTTKEEGQGSGLGLAVSYGIAKQHGGAIDFRSAPGKGTVFEVLLPVAAGVTREPLPDAERRTVRGGTETLLVADDEPLVRTLAERTLSQLGYRVLVAADGAQAVSLFRQAGGAVDLVVLDIIMPRGTGLQALREMRQERPGLRVLLMSGYTRETVDELLRAGAGFLPKPFEPAALAHKVRELLDGPAPSAAE